MNKWIFDIDGTLTPSRGRIDRRFEAFMLATCERNDVYFATGSDKEKTVEQIGEELYDKAKLVFNCSGNDIYCGSENKYRNDWKPSDKLNTVMEKCLQKSKCPVKTGNHIEQRHGMVNFSTVGRNATSEQRKEYAIFDNQNGERHLIAKIINKADRSISAQVAGETGLDIIPRGNDKGQIITYFNKDDTIHFYGDKMKLGGNDYPLANANAHGYNTEVKDWQDTYNRLLLAKAIGILK